MESAQHIRHCVMSLQLYCCGGVAIFVEFFFIVSGLLLALTIEKNKYGNPIKYIIHRYRRLWPRYIVYLLSYFVCIWIATGKIDQVLRTSFLPILGLQIFGIADYAHNYGAVWYVSVLIVCSYVLYTLLKYCRKLFVFLIGPAVFILGYIYILIENGSIIVNWDATRSVFSNHDLIRGFADMSLGITLYYVTSYIKEKFKFEFKTNFIEIALYLAAGVCAIAIKDSGWLCLFLVVGVVFSSVLGVHSNILFANRFVKKLASISYSIYLNHALFVDFHIIRYLGLTNKIINFTLFILAVTIYSAIFDWLITVLEKKIEKIFRQRILTGNMDNEAIH